MSRQRILVMAHAHPDFSLGGGEIAAYNLYQAYKRRSDAVEAAWFLARADRGQGATGRLSMRRPDEYLWEQAIGDWHLLKAAHRESLTTWFTDLIRGLRPTVVHTHHYAHLGLEYLRIIKQIDPGIQLLLTLHEYMAICHQNGQMVKAGTRRLCSQASPDDCHGCFPEISSEDFWLRKRFVQGHFDEVDAFIAPSAFLRQRYIDWGLPAERIHLIDNGQAAEPRLPPRALVAGEGRNRFGFFGQLNPYKGIDVLLEALTAMTPEQQARVTLEVHGANLEMQPADFQARIQALRAPLLASGCLQWAGPYAPHELRSRMAAVDWVVVPSTWWENSPMVIQEAMAMGRPLLVSDIGGMAEKVRDGVDGVHVRTGHAASWAAALLSCVDERLWTRMASCLAQPLDLDTCTERHLALVA